MNDSFGGPNPTNFPVLPNARNRKGFSDACRAPAARGCTEAGVRKASREETAGEFAPAVMSVYGDLAEYGLGAV
jgi:hypothetical protein